MRKPSQIDQLDEALDRILALPVGQFAPDQASPNPELFQLLEIGAILRDLPRENFKTLLKSELERKVNMATLVDQTAAIRQTATPRLRVKNADRAIEFYKNAFGAMEIMRFIAGGQIGHAEIAIGNSVVMLGEEALDYGFPGPETLGGSPVSIHLYVEDVDAFVARAIAAGARIVAPIKDQFYGDRGGSIADPFGYIWGVATRKEELTLEEMHRRFEAMRNERETKKTSPTFIPKGFHTVTPYLVAQNGAGLVDFIKRAFGADEVFRTIGSAGGLHSEIRIGDSMLMIGGGGPSLSWHGQASPAALHIFVKDTDAVYRRALEAGAASLHAPEDQPYGERGASVKDEFGNHWYIATNRGESYIPEGLQTVNPYLHPLRGEPLIGFLKRGLGAEEVAKYATPDGVIHHARIKIGDSILELGEAHGPYQPMASTFYLYVPNVDATYQRVLAAGATSISEPADQSYGDRSAGVKDVFGNQWYIATHIRDAE